LTPREHEVLALIVGGASTRRRASAGNQHADFEAHRAHLMESSAPETSLTSFARCRAKTNDALPVC